MKLSVFGAPLLAGAVLSACGGSEDAFRSAVSQRAAFDISCSAVTVQNIGGDSYGATGCGKKASYTCICGYHVLATCTKPICALDGSSVAPDATH